MRPDAVYHYADGNGNIYTLEQYSLTYAPVSPAESSTGTYNGGEPKSAVLTKQELQSVIQVFERAMNSRKDHIKNREKGSGAVTIFTGQEQQYCVLRAGSNAIVEIESLLNACLR